MKAVARCSVSDSYLLAAS